MTANDELARGWVLSSIVSDPTIASIALPALVGVSRVLTDVKGAMVSGGTARNPSLQVLFDGVLFQTLGVVSVETTVNTIGLDTWNGKIVVPTGVALTVKFSVTPGASNQQLLVIGGYDI